MKRYLLTGGLCLLLVSQGLSGCVRAEGQWRRRTTQTSPETNRLEQMRVGSLTRSYLIHLPPAYTKTKPTALVLAFHGGKGEAQRMSQAGDLNAFADRYGFIVVYPQGINNHWNDGRETRFSTSDDVGFITQLIQKLAQNYNINRQRIYATGISNGGMFSLRLACESEQIAAVAAVAATMPQNLSTDCAPKRSVSVLLILGTDDPLMPYQGGEILGPFRGRRGKVLSAADTVKFWTQHNQISALPTTQLLNRDPSDGTRVIRKVYGQHQDRAQVVLYEIQGGGHTWPGGQSYLPERLVGKVSQEINGNQVIWEFFSQHPLSK